MSIKTICAGIGTLALLGGLAASGTAATARTDGPHLLAGPGSTAGELHSLNWAGYVTTGGGTSASANWVVPSVRGSYGYSSSWVGIDGARSSTVEQTGTELDEIYGQLIYSAWVELYPAPMLTIQYQSGADVPVYPGDHMSGSVSANGDYYTIKLSDHTQNWDYARTWVDPSGRNSSTEVIAEAPSLASTGNVLPLANFGSEHFTSVHISGHATRTVMVARSGRVKASVTGSQRNFTVHFKYRGQFAS